jgi:hypothetical protein
MKFVLSYLILLPFIAGLVLFMGNKKCRLILLSVSLSLHINVKKYIGKKRITLAGYTPTVSMSPFAKEAQQKILQTGHIQAFPDLV